MAADRSAIGLSNFPLTGHVLRLVCHIPGEAHQMSRLAARRRKNIDDIFQSLLDLSDKIVAFEFPLTVPANLTGNENLPALRNDAVGITFRSRPILRLHSFKRAFAHETCSRNLNR